MSALIVAIFLASLTGSLHCAGMCGAFVTLAVVPNGNVARRRVGPHVMYHFGRLATYTTLGGVAGAVGSGIDLGGSMLGLQRLAALLAALMMIGFGLIAILRLRGVRVPRVPTPKVLGRLAAFGHRSAMSRPPLVRALVIGLLTTLLPCGWLYAFVIVAAGTGGLAPGMIAMAVFWIGTLPALVAVGVGARRLVGEAEKYVPLGTAIAVVLVGLLTLAHRVSDPDGIASVLDTKRSSPQEGLIDQVRRLDSGEVPCGVSGH